MAFPYIFHNLKKIEKIPLGGLFGLNINWAIWWWAGFVISRVVYPATNVGREREGFYEFLDVIMSLVCQTSQIQGHQLFKIIPELISYQNNVLSPWRNITSDNAKIDQSQVTSVAMWQCHVTVILYHDKKIEIIMSMELPGWRFWEMDSVIFILQSGEMHSWFKNAAKEMFI